MQQLQTIYIKFSNGKTGVFSGPAVVDVGEQVSIVDIKFGHPRELPSDYSWEEMRIQKGESL